LKGLLGFTGDKRGEKEKDPIELRKVYRGGGKNGQCVCKKAGKGWLVLREFQLKGGTIGGRGDWKKWLVQEKERKWRAWGVPGGRTKRERGLIRKKDSKKKARKWLERVL